MITLTLSRKLGLGFSSIIFLMLITAVVVLQSISSINRSELQLTSVRFPTVLASKDLLSHINGSIAALRGYMLLGSEADKGEEHKRLRQQSLAGIDNALERLQQLSSQWQDDNTRQGLANVMLQLEGFKQSQQSIEEISNTDDNIPSYALMIYDAGPFAQTLLDQLDVLVKEEAGLEPTQERKNLLKLFADSQSSFSNAFSFIRSYLISGSDEDREKYNSSMVINDQRTREIDRQAFLFNDTQKSLWSFYLDMRESFAPLAQEIFQLRSADDWNVANYKMGADLVPRAQQLTAEVEAIIANQQALMLEDQAALREANARMGVVMKVATGLAVIISALIALLLARQLLASLTPINHRAQQIADGDLSGKALPIRSRDELGELTGAINRMSSQLRELVTDVSASARQVSAGSEQLHEANQKIADGMLEQTSKITSIATAIEEMSATADDVAQNTAEAAGGANDCVEIARHGGSVVEQTIETINAIHHAVTESNQAVLSLSAQGEEIGRITEVIRGIAEQTNLLALNAAIEAARAGDQGRGFAVVADEVRQLAQRTSESTTEISQSIQSIQQETQSAVQKMAKGMKLVEVGRDSAQGAGGALSSVIDNVNRVSGMVASIASATEQQSAVSSEVANTIEEISFIIQQASESTSDNAIATDELSRKAVELQATISRFSTG
ncbi:methyl-accepting chemotaxis protein [Aestuariirhabdus litorea]|uniref:Methyl-accepting chemotaxis protein n=1 Tax=Aestuariirhabdus litorea TaxID=2528527 RepID=A0A3P3VQR5_9GAMM|nr:methyl-accepting chemotaxis protein [Aestuariirhabdus litorea]RRJ83163.1 methyl-accepting chemotaxis protein [Aestuariirhabdus litorea]RWW93320.1 HAMP domain-containing protein [Endozoicomonadaceae bacterium GTF-13]